MSIFADLESSDELHNRCNIAQEENAEQMNFHGFAWAKQQETIFDCSSFSTRRHSKARAKVPMFHFERDAAELPQHLDGSESSAPRGPQYAYCC